MTNESRRLVAVCLLLAFLQLALSLYRLESLNNVGDYDGAWYYQVARSFSRGEGLTQLSLWNFTSAPDRVVQPACDYWSPGWPLVLGLLMKVAGDSQESALYITALLSVFQPVIVAVLALEVTGELVAAFLAGLICSFTQAYSYYRVIPECMLAYHLLVGLGLWLAIRSWRIGSWRWLGLAGVVFGLAAAFRGEGFLPAAATLMVLLWRPLRGVSRGRAAAIFGCGLGLGLVPLLSYNLTVFGRLTPLPRSLVPWMAHYLDLYSITTQPSPARWWHLGIPRIVSSMELVFWEQCKALAGGLPWPLFVLALGGSVWLLRRGSIGTALLWVLLALTVIFMAVVAPYATLPARSVYLAGWVLAIPAGMAADLLSRRGSWLARVGLAGLLVGLATFGFWPLPAFSTSWYMWQIKPAWLVDPRVAQLQLTRQDLVLTDHPMQLSAFLDVPAVMCPVDQVLPVFRYRPNYIVVGTDAEDWLPRFRQEAFHGVPVELLFTVQGTQWYRVLYQNSPAQPATGGLRP